MRLALVLSLLAACADPPLNQGISITPWPHAPIGVGLVQFYSLAPQDCGTNACIAADLDQLTASVTGSAVELIGVGESLTILGVAPGDATITLTGPGINQWMEVSVEPIATATLVADRTIEPGKQGPDLGSSGGPIQAFAGSVVQLSEIYLDASGKQLMGSSPLTITTTTLDIVDEPTCRCADFYAPACRCVLTGDTLGTATIDALGATAELDVVDASAIADFSLFPAAPLSLAATAGGDPQRCVVLPTDAAHRTIVGHGEPVRMSVDDPAVAGITPGFSRFMQPIDVTARQPGTTMIELTWGAVHHGFPVTVVGE